MSKNVKQIIIRYILIILGVSMAAIAISVFYTPNKIVSGGFGGVATILYHRFHIRQGITLFFVNAILLIISYKILGKEFVFNTAGGAILLAVLVEVFSYIPPITDDMLLATVFGALLYGTGTGLTLINCASTGGTDILSRLIQTAIPHVKIGSILLTVDFIVILFSLINFRKVDLVMYGIIALFISSVSINFMIGKLNITKLAFVISEKGQELTNHLAANQPRGITIIDAKGVGAKRDLVSYKNVIMCAFKESEIEEFQKRVLEVDSTAFIIFSESSQIVGKGFRVYK